MNSFLYETHVHTRESSPCGRVSAKEVVRCYVKGGYSGCIITDHYYASTFEPGKKKRKSWEEQIDQYLSGFTLAKSEAEKHDFDVFLGVELTLVNVTADILIFGIDENFLYTHPRLYALSPAELKKLADNKGVLLFEAHPFRPTVNRVNPRYLHGAEVYNGNMRHDSKNSRAKQWAYKNNLLMISGSDFHKPEDAYRGGVVLSKRPKNIAEFCCMIKDGVELIES